MNLFFIMFGSGIGAVLRHLTNETISKNFPTTFPYATLSVNIIGSFIIGICAQHFNANASTYLFLAIGFCGGYTTFSAHMLEIYNMYLKKSTFKLIIYLSLTFLLSVAACYVGYKI